MESIPRDDAPVCVLRREGALRLGRDLAAKRMEDPFENVGEGGIVVVGEAGLGHLGDVGVSSCELSSCNIARVAVEMGGGLCSGVLVVALADGVVVAISGSLGEVERELAGDISGGVA